MVPIQFEFKTEKYDYTPEFGSYVKCQVDCCVIVLQTFKHHFAGDIMYKIRFDQLWPNGNATSEEQIISEREMNYMLSLRNKE